MEPILNRDAAAHGVTAKELRGPAFVQPARGVSMLASRQADLAATCRAVAKVLPADVTFSHVTSAMLRGWWLPHLDDRPLIASTAGDGLHAVRRGVFLRRIDRAGQHREEFHGLPVASPAWTIVELAEHLALVDLVVVIDCALHQGDVTVDQIREAMVRGRRGVRVLRLALVLCDPRSESRWETILRLLHVLSGIAVEPQFRITNRLGVVIARADLRISGTRRVPEYDGAAHRDRVQHEDDLRRDKVLARLGYERYGYIATEILRNPGNIVADAERALGMPHDPKRVQRWQAAALESSLSTVGWVALQRRMDRFVRAEPPRLRPSRAVDA